MACCLGGTNLYTVLTPVLLRKTATMSNVASHD